jgi:hypothetical protein
MIYKLLKINKVLDKWLLGCDNSHFPSGSGGLYKTQFTHISKHLAKYYHGEVEKAVIIAALKEKKCGLAQIPYLNNHGLGHVEVVTHRATELLQRADCKITPYEGYLLLLAIQFHDLGNIFGRTDHEKRCREIMAALGNLAGIDEPEKRAVIGIAAAHGGLLPDGDKDDTIYALEDEQDLMGQKVRARMLAAILRFSDELADDSGRASAAMVKLGKLPDESIIYHLYSLCLHSVMIDEKEIRLSFQIEANRATEEYLKNNDSRVFLLDEIYARTYKMYTEMLYCMRFLRPLFKIDRIQIEIKVFPPETVPTEPLRITYTLEERGYPHYDNNIFSICENLEKQTGVLVKEQIVSEWGVGCPT